MTARWKLLSLRAASLLLPFAIVKPAVTLLLATTGIGFAGRPRESGELALLMRLSRLGILGPTPVVVDVGAHLGEYIEAVKEAWPAAKIYGFEPSPAHYARLTAVVQGGKYQDVRLFQKGLSATTGRMSLHKTEEISGMASLEMRDLRHLGLSPVITEDVAITTLDEIAASEGIDVIDFIKIDVEGHEYKTLLGARSLLSQRRIRIIQFEYGHAHVASKTSIQDFFNYLMPNGYVMGIVKPTGRIKFFDQYDEFLEMHFASNYVAMTVEVAAKLGHDVKRPDWKDVGPHSRMMR